MNHYHKIFRFVVATMVAVSSHIAAGDTPASQETGVSSYSEKLPTQSITARKTLKLLTEAGNEAMAGRNTKEARADFEKMLAAASVSPYQAAWAGLRIAQSYLLENNLPAAKESYLKVSGNSTFPPHFRQEAAEMLEEMSRTAQGLPARDLTASRTDRSAVVTYAAEVWVAPDGDDANSGLPTKPVATLLRARDRVRELRKTTPGAIAVILKNGNYPLQASLELTDEDSGREGNPTVWKAEERGKVTIFGGKKLTGFAPVVDPAARLRLLPEARDQVLVCDLSQNGVTDFGSLAVRVAEQPSAPPSVELYVDKKPQTLARWPNKGFVNGGKVIAAGNKDQGSPSVFEYLDDRHLRWMGVDDVWMYGYWRNHWADGTLKIGKIDPKTKQISSVEPYWYLNQGLEGTSPNEGIKYHVFNLLEELDQPGEWYLDRKAGKLYLWPTGNAANQDIELGMLSSPFVVTNNTSHIQFRDLVFNLGRHDGIQISGGKQVELAGCVVSRVGGAGVLINGGIGHTLLGCDIHHTGRAATRLTGGDRTTLEPAEFLIENCHIHHFGRIDCTYSPAIGAAGVGMRFAHNLMSNGPSSAVRVDGNDMVMEYNDVHSVVLESGDQGAMESWGNPTYRGYVFRYNRFENIGHATESKTAGISAIRLDDTISGSLIYGNIFIRSAFGIFGAVQIHAGRDNIVDNNVVVDCRAGVTGGWNNFNKYWLAAKNGSRKDFLTSELYLKRYPDLERMLDDNGINFVSRLAMVDCGPAIDWGDKCYESVAVHSWTTKSEGTINTDKIDWNDMALRLGFRPLPLSEMGLYAGSTRATWPVKTTPLAVPNWRELVSDQESVKE